MYNETRTKFQHFVLSMSVEIKPTYRNYQILLKSCPNLSKLSNFAMK